MKIWFDLTNSPHINFFRQMIEELKAEGHKVVITCRPLANTVDLLDLYNMDYTVVGKHYGKSSYKKAMGFFVRVWQLRKFLKSVKASKSLQPHSISLLQMFLNSSIVIIVSVIPKRRRPRRTCRGS